MTALLACHSKCRAGVDMTQPIRDRLRRRPAVRNAVEPPRGAQPERRRAGSLRCGGLALQSL
jgi:hypothetical protein